ncbi:MAG: 16S rRNA (uracil(1498)-N(3))-methyltransferase [Robiginitomaculum sp.]
MRQHYTLSRLYVSQALAKGKDIGLLQSQAHFLGCVMRKNVGEHIRVFNGEDGEWLAEIFELAKRKAKVKIREQIRAPLSVPDIWLLFAPVKKTRNLFIVEKAVELGAARICPVITARTIWKIRMDKMDAHIIEAAEQTERLDLPLALPPQSLVSLLETWDQARTLVFADEAGGAAPAAKALAKVNTPCAILIGPEGGFTDKERAMLRNKPYVRPISLGPRILRADTAAFSTLALWQAVSGDW